MSDLTPSSISSTTPTPSGKSKTGLYIGLFIFIIVVFAGAGVGIYFLTKSQSGSSTGSTASGDKKTDTSDDKKTDTSGDKKKDTSGDKKKDTSDDKKKDTNNPPTPGTYTSISNTNTESRMGCPYTIGLTTSSANEAYVKNTCDVDPKCVGYYVGSAGWNIATQTLPSECTDNSGTDGYSVFKSKSSNYTSAVNPKNKFGCIYNPGLTTSDANEDYVKKTCDVDPKCVGYYKGSTGWCVATQTLPTDCKNATGDAGYKEFMKKS
jgi:hypothetical protein